jgi:hypothetical protein
MDYGTQVYDAGMAGIVPGTVSDADPNSSHPTAGDFGMVTGTGTGQHGVTPLFGNPEALVTDAVNDVWEWLNQPFKNPMSAVGIFALVGSAIVAIMLWNLILYHIRIAAETI